MAFVTAPREERRMLGIGIILLSQLMFVMVDPSAKWLAGAHLPTSEIVFIRYFEQWLLTLLVFLPRRGRALFVSRAPKLELARAVAIFASTICNFLAVRFLPVTVTGSIQFTTPLIVCMLSIPLLGEQVGWRRWSAIAVGFIGVLVVIRPGASDFNPAVLISLAGSTAGGFYTILVRRLAGTDSAATQQFYSSSLAVCCMLPFAFGGWIWPDDDFTWLIFCIIGVAGMIGHMLSTSAARFAPASVLAPFSYLQIVYLTVISIFVFGQPPTVWNIVGAVIVVIGGLYMGVRERRLSRPSVAVVIED
jgi:drug/metabolite transporter (DMT)-like permease